MNDIERLEEYIATLERLATVSNLMLESDDFGLIERGGIRMCKINVQEHLTDAQRMLRKRLNNAKSS